MTDRNKRHKALSTNGGILSKVQQAWGPGPLHKAKLSGPAPDRLYLQPSYPRTPDRILTENFLQGKIQLAGTSVEIQGNLSQLWEQLPKEGEIFDYSHGFSWLQGIALLNREGSDLLQNNTVKDIVEGWLDHHENWSPSIWSPALVAERLMHWCCQSDMILKHGDTLWRSRFLNSMAHQARHLAHVAHKAPPGIAALNTAMGLCLAGLCLPACDVALERGQELMRRELRLQVRSDGGHISRNPSNQLELVIRLQMVEKAYLDRGIEVPGHLRLVLGRATSMVQFFRCPDGKLAVFNGGYEDDSSAIIETAKIKDEDAIPFGFARYTQYQRLNAARALLIADVGARLKDTRENAVLSNFTGSGSFQFSSGRNRLVVNCGNGDHLGGEWPKAMRQDSAHSGLSFEGNNHKSIFTGETKHHRLEEVSGILLEITKPFHTKSASVAPAHDSDMPGWQRRLYLAAGGDDLRGEDRLFNIPLKLAALWRFRFHLAPGIKASLARDEQSVILACPNEEGWRFRTNFTGLRLENSVYCGCGGAPLNTEQIVLAPSITEHGAHQGHERGVDMSDSCDIIIKWAFKRLDGV